MSIDLARTYPPRFFARRHKLSWRAPFIVQAVRCLRHPRSVIDVGCGVGDIVGAFVREGIDAYGIEGTDACVRYLECERERVRIFDLRTPDLAAFAKGTRFDIGLCFEVLEHIEAEYIEAVLAYLHELSDCWVTSIAQPAQEGVGHVNLQEPGYWCTLFARHGFVYDVEAARKVRLALFPIRAKDGVRAIFNNLLVFVKE
jgi:SAM-dependent methyltransferase